MDFPKKDKQKLTAIHEQLFGERNRDVVEARARVLDTVRAGSGILDALDALERAVEHRSVYTIRNHAWPATADLDTIDLVADLLNSKVRP